MIIQIRISPELHARIREAALRAALTQSAWVRMKLTEILREGEKDHEDGSGSAASVLARE